MFLLVATERMYVEGSQAGYISVKISQRLYVEASVYSSLNAHKIIEKACTVAVFVILIMEPHYQEKEIRSQR